MDEIRSIVAQVTASIDITTTLFYQQKTEDGYECLNQTLSVLSQGMGFVFQFQKEHDIIALEEQQLNHILSQAMSAMEAKDTILLADILQYELKELLQAI